jgi:hypothetical protein
VWGQPFVGARRSRPTPLAFHQRSIEEALIVTRTGTVVVARDYVYDGGAGERGPGHLHEQELRAHFGEGLRAAREILVEYGGHGDLRLIYRLDLSERGIWFQSIPNLGAFTPERVIDVELETSFEDESAEARVFAVLLRAVGFGPVPSDRQSA